VVRGDRLRAAWSGGTACGRRGPGGPSGGRRGRAGPSRP